MNLEYQGLLVTLKRTFRLLFIAKESGYCSDNIFGRWGARSWMSIQQLNCAACSLESSLPLAKKKCIFLALKLGLILLIRINFFPTCMHNK